MHAVVVETEAQSPMVASRLHKYAKEPRDLAPFAPSADPAAAVTASPQPHKLVGPQIFDASKATPLEDPTLVSAAGYTVQLSEHQIAEVQQHADEKLFALYPKTRGRIGRRHVVPPSLGGRLIANTSYKYSSPLTSQTDIQVEFVIYRVSLIISPLMLYMLSSV